MRDPYDVLGISRGARFDEVKAAYRRACKSKHPDMGGSQEDFVELQAAYESILTDLKRGYQQQDPPRADRPQDRGRWESAYRDIDDELEELRRDARAREEALRSMRTQAWQDGNKVVWAKLTWQDVSRFVTSVMRSGVKGIALLCAALIGLGSVLVEANAVSAIIMLGGGVGFVLSQALKSDKGGMLSAGLLLFGIMTIWLPPVRLALIHFPLATISLLLCLALIFKFGQQGGMVGLMTGGVLTLYVIGAIITQSQQPEQVVTVPPGEQTPSSPPPNPKEPPNEAPTPARATPEVRELIASKGAVLKFVAGVTYRLKIRSGFTTSLSASSGRFAPYRGDDRKGACTEAIDLSAPSDTLPYTAVEGSFRACGSDAVLRVVDVR